MIEDLKAKDPLSGAGQRASSSNMTVRRRIDAFCAAALSLADSTQGMIDNGELKASRMCLIQLRNSAASAQTIASRSMGSVVAECDQAALEKAVQGALSNAQKILSAAS